MNNYPLKLILKHLLLTLSTFAVSTITLCQTIESVALKEKQFHTLKTNREKKTMALDIIEEYTYLSQTDKAQQWTYELVSLNYEHPNDTIDYYIRTNQAEIFYWCNLFEYAEHPANEALKIAKQLNDSIFISNAAMFVAYVKEMQDSLNESIYYARYANQYFPKIVKNGYRVMIDKSQIINNLAQIYVKLKEVDSAIYYNRMAYPLALAEQSERAIIYCDYNYANIYFLKNQIDSAKYFMKKSNVNAIRFRKYDLLLQNYTTMLDLYPNNKFEQDHIIQQCFLIIDTNEIAPLNKVFFYKKAINFFRQNNNKLSLAILQEKYIKLQDEISKQGNKEVQKISQKFVENENHYLQLKLAELKQKRKLTNLQIITILLTISLGIISYIFYNRRRKEILENIVKQQKLIANERFRIANDLHDDLGTNLSRIRYITNALPEIISKEEMQKNYSKIISLSDDSVDKMNEIIWSLKQEEFTIDELFSYIRKLCSEISEEKNIQISYAFLDDLEMQKIQAEVCRNLYLTVKEALHNAIKHSKASLIEINSEFSDRLIFKIKDNGIGFQENQPTGNGILNMKKRMQLIQGSIQIESNTQGTLVTIASNVI